MTTSEFPRTGPIGFIVVIVGVLLVLFLGYSALIFTEHAQVSHAPQVSDIQHCFNGGGALSGWLQMPNGRYGRYCQLDNNLYWRIYECQATERVVVTQFKQAFRKLQNYITNKGFVPVSEPPCY